MIENIAFLILSLVLLFFGAEALVRGGSSAAIRLGLSPLVVGLTVVAFGTSSPELVVSLKSALVGQGDIAVGNVVGSNSFNIGFILGLTALVCPLAVHRQIIKLDAPIALGVAILLPLLLMNGVLARWEAAFLFAGIVAYTALNIHLARKSSNEPETYEAPGTGVLKNWFFDIVFILGGLGILVLGSRLLVDNSVSLARTLGVSEAVIGLTIIAAGTSMPELATSLVAAIRKQADIAVGNVVGSNVFNILGILGISGLAKPLESTGVTMTDYGFMVGFTILLLPLLYTGRVLHRLEGALLLGLYGVYLAILWPK
jgi:cation:H+ antiporter